MEGLRRLSQLYSDTKRASDVVVGETKVGAPRIPELIDLHLAFRIQRERLSAWGLEWSDDSAVAEDPSIDEEVARAGLTSTVVDVLENIQNIFEKADQLYTSTVRSATGVKSSEKARIARKDDNFLRWTEEDRIRYERLAQDLTNSIDLLYDLSRTRRELRQGTYPSSGKAMADRPITPPAPPPAKSLFLRGAYSESEETLVNPSRASTTKTLTSLELPSRLDPSLLDLPEEQPPPYDSIGATQSSRMIAYLKQPQFPSASSGSDMEVVKIPVLVEFAPFDPAYSATGVSPPSQRLDALLAFYARTSVPFDGLPSGTLSCLGFFEDPKAARYGLVYELPKSCATTLDAQQTDHKEDKFTPVSLLKTLQASSRVLHRDAKALPFGPSLEDRFRVAFNLVHAFSRMHTEENLTHKDFNSGNIIFFPKSADSENTNGVKYDIRTPFVTSFDLFTEYNLEYATTPIARNIYRSQDDPKVSGNPKSPVRACSVCKPQPCNCSPFRFDIYSLGLVLLEIGLWMNLADIYKSKYTLEHFKHRIDNIWVKRLGSKCGSVYMKVVEDMLTKSCSNITEDSLLGLYNRWLSMLQKCCSIDENEDQFPIIYHVKGTTTPPSLTQSRTQSWSPKSNHRPFSRLGQATTLPFAITEAGEEESGSMESSTTQVKRSIPTLNDPATSSVYLSAAQTIQRAWRQHSSTMKSPFQQYRRKVSLIQTQWRKKRLVFGSNSATSSSENVYPISQDDVVVEAELIHARTSEHSVVHIERNANYLARPKLRIHNVMLQPEMLDLWHEDLQPQLERIVERALKHSPESASIEIAMVGETEATVKPTIFVTCTSTSRVRAALARKFNYDPEMFDLKVRKGKIRRSKATRTQRSPPPHRSMVGDDNSTRMPLNPYHQKRPLCGASIGAYVGKHLPPVSFGGMVDVDGELFGMTVHHLLDDPSDDDADDDDSVYEVDATGGAQRSSSRRVNVDDMVRGTGGHPSLQSYPTDSMFPLEISDDEEDSMSDDDNFSSDAGYESEEEEEQKPESMDESGTQGDVSGILAGSHCDVLVTQPALDDVDEHFFPCEEDRDEDHLDSHTLGHVYASSGIKRWNRKGILHEIDWALLKMDDDRLQPCNLIQGGKKYCRADQESKKTLTNLLVEPVCRGSYTEEDDEFPTVVAQSDDMRNLPVHCFGRTSGLQGGVIGPAMSSVRIYKRRSFSRSWYVMGDFGGMYNSTLGINATMPESLLTYAPVGGDSGAWVIDNDQGRVCGHVLAWCERNSIAYICPADVLLEDMKRTLGANRVGLPGSFEEHHKSSQRLITAGPDAASAPGSALRSSMANHGLPDIARLGLGDGNMLSSRLNASAVSPRMEMRRLFGGGIAR
jgi:hypothetical protein